MIEGERVRLRPLLESDVEAILSWSADEEMAQLVEGDYPRSREEFFRWADDFHRDRQRRYFIIEKGNRPIGDIELDYIAWRSKEAELRIRIGERSLWNQGYGTESILTLLNYVFAEMGLRRIYLRVFADNGRAIRCYEKCGFKREGTLVRTGRDGRPRRILLMRILNTEFLPARIAL